MKMKKPQEAMIAYLATLLTILLLTVLAAVVVAFSNVDLDRLVGALGFIGAAVTGLIGVIGTFRPKGDPDVTMQPEGEI